jgi:hypothetical protein
LAGALGLAGAPGFACALGFACAPAFTGALAFAGALAWGFSFASPAEDRSGALSGKRASSRDFLSGSRELRMQSAREKDMRHLMSSCEKALTNLH